jgi:PmbA protein
MAKDRRLIMSSLKSFSKKDAQQLVSKMILAAKKVPQNEEYNGIAKGKFKYPTVKEIYDPKVAEMQKEAVDITKQSIDIVKKKAKKAAGVFEKGEAETYLLSSNGLEREERSTGMYLSMRAMMNKNASGHTVTVSRMKNKFDYIKTAEKAAQIAKQAKMPRKSVSGKYDVLFDTHAFANVLEHFAHSASIFSVEAGLSCLPDMVGKKVAGDSITIYDDATYPNGYGSTAFDDEGHPTQKNVLVDKGIFKGYLHNTSTAKRYKTKSTANAGLISPSPHNIVFKPGKVSNDELLSSMKKGIYITNVWYTRFNNHATGDFSTIPRDGAFYVENGEIKHALKDVRISDNLLRMMKNISLVGKEVEQIRGWEVETPTITPCVVIKDVNITKPN